MVSGDKNNLKSIFGKMSAYKNNVGHPTLFL